jgi:hypothetical protein
MTLEQFKRTFAAVKPGTYVTYHTGHLFFDRQIDKVVNEIAREAWRAYKDYRAVLIQKRVGHCVFDYIAIKI